MSDANDNCPIEDSDTIKIATFNHKRQALSGFGALLVSQLLLYGTYQMHLHLIDDKGG